MLREKRQLSKPDTILFDWHGTLVDTSDAMFNAMEEMLPQLEELSLLNRLLSEKHCKTLDDVKLVRYIRIFRRLHPKILAERRVSRTDILNAIFGHDNDAIRIAHETYNNCYRHYYGKVHAFQEGTIQYLSTLKNAGIKLGIASNRSREFLEHELDLVENGHWKCFFNTICCADDVNAYKPAPDILEVALQALGQKPSLNTWYIGDSHQDIITAKNAGVTAILYNGHCWDRAYMDQLFAHGPNNQHPDAIINSYDELMDLLSKIQKQDANAFTADITSLRPQAYGPPPPPARHLAPDWHPSVADIMPPKVILFDWHATLVDTLDAMYHAVDDMLPSFKDNGLLERMVDPEHSKSPEDAKLIEYVRDHAQLHPKISADRKISRTDIFEVLFGEDHDAKQLAHSIFTEHYRNHFGTALPFEPQVKNMLIGLRALELKVGIITNRDREFFEQELLVVENGSWTNLFDVSICGDDTPLRKPHPDPLIKAAEALNQPCSKDVWYVGDSTTDIIAAKNAGQTAVFFNGAQWDSLWLEKIFPGTERHPHKPDVVVNDFSEFWALVLSCLSN